MTGGAGYIGSNMVLCLLDAGEQVIVIDNLSEGYEWAVDKRADFIQADLKDLTTIHRIIAGKKIKSVLHFAGSISVNESTKDPVKYYQNNTVNSLLLLQACIDNGVENFIFSSTAAVYGNLGMEKAVEDATKLPESSYGNSKLLTEIIIGDIAKANGLRTGILRYFNVAGADPQGRCGQTSKNSTHLIKIAVETALGKRETMSIFGDDYGTPDGTCIRDYIHVTDLVDAHYLVLQALRDGKSQLVFNAGYGVGYSVLEVLNTVKQVGKVDFPVLMAGRREGDPARIVADSNKLCRELNWQPRYNDLAKIVLDALTWEKKLSSILIKPTTFS